MENYKMFDKNIILDTCLELKIYLQGDKNNGKKII